MTLKEDWETSKSTATLSPIQPHVPHVSYGYMVWKLVAVMSAKTHKTSGAMLSNVVDGNFGAFELHTRMCYHIYPHPQLNSQAAR